LRLQSHIQAWTATSCPKKTKPGVWHGTEGLSAFHVSAGSRFVVCPPGGEPVQMVAHCDLHAQLLCHVLNVCDLSDPMAAVTSVLELLAFCVSAELGQIDHAECNMGLLFEAFRDWFLLTLEKRVEAVVAVCARQGSGASLCDFIKVIVCACVCVCVYVCF
jgi:hypothetical protein